MSYRLFLFSILVWLSTALQGKPPELSPRDTRVKVEEILKAHATYHVLTPDLVQRALQNFLEELDPSKTYLLENEVTKWTNPSPELLSTVLEGYKRESFTTFQEIHALMVLAIERRNQIEAKIKNLPTPKDVLVAEFKKLSWAKDPAELESRLLKIKGLQKETAEKYDPEIQSTFFQRIDKRRLNHEQELISAAEGHRLQTVLSLVLKATSAALDSQTNYFTPSEAGQFMMQVEQRLFGIGAQLRDDLNGFTIVRILEGGPAQDSKLKVNDKIIAVNREPVVGMDVTEAVEYIRGPQGTPVTLTILRKMQEGGEDEKLDIEILRGEVVLKDTRFESNYEPFGDGVIGILKLYSFYQDPKYSSSSDLLQAINELKKQHPLKGIILDLRSNAGGLLPQAVSVAGLFMSKGVVVSVKDNTGQIQRLRNIDSKVAFDGPLIILTNRTSASAAEIVSQTLQEYGRALVVGDGETYGKGTFQTFTLESTNFGKVNPKGEYKVTRGRYYTVSGKSPQLVGVSADIVVPGVFSTMEIGEKYSKYPLATDQISPSFNDDLSDVPAIHRNQVMRLYKFNLQPVLTTYQPYLAHLKKNSSLRLEGNKNYRNFLSEIDKKEFSSEPSGIFGQTDLQLSETVNIMKDLLFLNKST
jgi:carboxyl-terminal processing protease